MGNGNGRLPTPGSSSAQRIRHCQPFEVKVHTIVMHHRPHVDELAALLLALTYGQKIFPGLKEALNAGRFQFWGKGNQTPDGRPAAAWEEEGYLIIGTGGSRFDEHVDGLGSGRRANECAAILMAKHLGVADNSELGPLLRAVLANDSRGGDLSLGLPTSLACLYRYPPSGVSEAVSEVLAIKIVMLQLTALIKAQVHFFQAVEEVKNMALETVICPSGVVVSLVFVQSDNEEVAKAARHLGIKLCVVRRSNGHVQITVAQKHSTRINLGPVVSRLRAAELRQTGEAADDQDLCREGFLAGWYYLKVPGWCFNGTPTATDIPATQLSSETLLSLIRDGLAMS